VHMVQLGVPTLPACVSRSAAECQRHCSRAC
jgi:hypothetical protein